MAMAAGPMGPTKKPPGTKAAPPMAPEPEPFDPSGGMYALQQQQFASQQQAIQEDLARQQEQYAEMQRQRAQQLAWQQEEVGRRTGQLQTELPQTLGRLGSQFAARGSYQSGARQEAQTDVEKQTNLQIEDMKRAASQQQTQAQWEEMKANWEKQGMETQARRQLEALDRERESEELQYKAGLSQKATSARQAAQIDPDKYRSQAIAYRDARINVYRNQGLDARGAQAQAIYDMKTRYPGLDETWLYAGSGGAPPKTTKYGTYDMTAQRGMDTDATTAGKVRVKPAYKGMVSQIQAWIGETGGQGSDSQFINWFTKKYPGEAGMLKSNPILVSVALSDTRYGR